MELPSPQHTLTHTVMAEPTSWFGLNKQDYWSWIKTLPDYYFLDKLVELDNLTVDKVLMCPSPFSVDKILFCVRLSKA